MTNSINSVYFNKNGLIPEEAVDYLTQLAADTKTTGFSVHFWTEVAILNPEIKTKLNTAGVIIHDDQEVEEPLASVIRKFVNQGHNGDLTSYAIASDILRIAALKKAGYNDLYIYFDCNDIRFSNLASELPKVKERFSKNPWGLSFPINRLEFLAERVYEKRNDVIIAKKNQNPFFFFLFLQRFTEVVLEKHPQYKITNDPELQKKQADKISSFVTSIPFDILANQLHIIMTPYYKIIGSAPIEDVDITYYLTIEHLREAGNSWRDKARETDLKAILFDHGLTFSPPIEENKDSLHAIRATDDPLPPSLNSFFDLKLPILPVSLKTLGLFPITKRNRPAALPPTELAVAFFDRRPEKQKKQIMRWVKSNLTTSNFLLMNFYHALQNSTTLTQKPELEAANSARRPERN